MVSLRWLALFRDFKDAEGANQGQTCLVYLYSCLDTLNRGTLHQLVGPQKPLEVSFFLFSFTALVCAKENYNSCSYKLLFYKLYPFHLYKLSSLQIVFILYTIFFQTEFTCKLYSCKLNSCLSFLLQHQAIQYGFIVQRTNLSLRDSIAVKAHLEGLCSDDVSMKFNAFYCVLHMLLMSPF